MCFVFNYGEQRPHAALAMAKKKPQHPPDVSLSASWKKPSTQVPLVWDQPHASHINKKSNSHYLTGAMRENQITTWGEINRKTIAVDFNQNQNTLNKRKWHVCGLPLTTNRNQKKDQSSSILRGPRRE